MAFGSKKEARTDNDRFVCKHDLSAIHNYVVVDKETGVNYLYGVWGTLSSPSLAITPLLDENGNVIVTK